MKVLLIYTRELPQSPNKPLVDFETIQFGISYVSAYLKKHGHETKLLVLTRKSHFSIIDDYIEKFSPELVGFTSVASEYSFIEKIGKYIKSRYPDLFLLIGGIHVSMAPDESMLDTFDSLCIGEGEEATFDLIEQLEQGISPTGIPNLWIKKQNSIEKNPSRPFIDDLDSVPYPDRQMWEEWIDFERSSERPSILLGRGCPYNCTYCCNHAIRKLAKGPYVRFRSPDNIIGEIKEILDRFPHTKEFYCEVETFSAHWKWSLELCSRLEEFNSKRTQPLSFGVNIRITKDFMKRNIDEYFGRLKRANFRFINVGLESGSERIRREVLKRDYSNEDLIHAIEKAKKHNLEIIFFNMVGFPYETLDDFHETVRLNQICLPDWHYLSIFYPYPGTDLHNLCEEMGVLPKDLLDLELERISAPLDFPDFHKKQIQKAFIWFDYYVYKDHKPMDFLTNNLLYKYRLVYGQNIDDKLPRLIAQDLLDPSLRFDERYQVDIISWELVKKFPELEQIVLSKPRSQQVLKHKQVNPKKIKLKACSLNLGELHQLADFGFFNPVFHCETEDRDEFIASMRLHITEPLEQLIIADPRAFNDDGYAANSTGSQILKRRSSYNDVNTTENFVSNPALLNGAALYEIQASEIKKALLNGYDFQSECNKSRQVSNRETSIAFTCHDPQIIGGGNTILFRYVNWLAKLGIKSTIYSCGHHPSWKRVRAKFRNFSTYSEMFSAIEEDIVVIFSMWHIEPILKTNPSGKRIYHLRQTYESLNYGKNFQSMLTRKPVIELLESLPLGAITTSPHLHEWYKHKLGIESFQITNGINLEVFYPHKKKHTKSLTKRIVSVGNPMHYLKGVDVLANSLMLISKKRPELNFKWTIASGEKGKLNSSQVLAENLEFSYRTGLNQTQMRELYQNADLFVNPSLYEGFGLPALEAMACGTPVIQTDNHGLDSIVEDNHNALVVPLNNPVKMAESIERIIDDEKLTERLRTQGFETVRRYSLANQFDMFINAFEEITQIPLPAAKAGMIRSKLATNYTNVTFSKDLQAVQRTSVENKSLVSVVIPTYNQAQYLREALESLLAQTYSHWEAIVVNDGSTDNTNEVMNEYSKRDSRIKPITKINGGITSALNEGLKYCQGDYFCWLSSDDLYYPNKLETLIKAFENLDEDYALTYGSFDILQEESHTIKVQPFQKSKMKGVEFPEALKFDFIDGCSMMIRMDVMREVDGFNPYYLHSQDSELWMRIASRGYRFHLVDKKVTIRRVHAAQASTSNVIYCRYDAAWMINYYLVHFHLLEMYRYFDLTKNDDIERFVEHFVGRMLHTEAVVNHPLIQQKFWRWFDQGLTALVPDTQIIILKKCLNLLLSNKTATYKIDYYLKECLNALSKKREYAPFTPNFSVEGRDIRYDNREKDELAKDLFDYSSNLLVNSHTPLFAQELHLHNCHQIVDTPFKLAHSAIRYLSQFANQYQEIASSHADLSHIPANQDEATTLFCSLRYPDLTEAFDQSLAFDPGRMSNLDSIAEYEKLISEMRKKYKQDLQQICKKNPTVTILHYWNALALAAEEKFAEALDEGWKTLTLNHESCDWRIAYRLGVWAEKVNNFEKATIAYSMGQGSNPSFLPFTEGLDRVLQKTATFSHHTPMPKQFIYDRENNGISNATLSDCQIRPLVDGSYILALNAISENGQTFNLQGKLPYTHRFKDLRITDPYTNNSLGVSANSIFNLWAGGYNFTKESFKSYKQLLNNKVSVAFTIRDSSILGGGPLIVYRYVNWLSSLGVDVTVYSNDTSPEWININARFQHIPNDAERYSSIVEPVVIVYSILELPTLLRYCNTEGKQILHLCQGVEDFHYYGQTFTSLMAPKSIFEILHSLPVGRLTVSPHIQDYFHKQYAQQSYNILNGIDLNIYMPRWKRPVYNEINILTIGNPRRLLKGAEDVKEAVSLLARKYPEWKLHLTIVSGEKVAPIHKKDSTIPGFTHSLHCCLSPEELREKYYEADVYINPTWYEGFGLPTIEAMACGVPVIQADNQGLDSIVHNGQNCLIVPPQNPRRITGALESLIKDHKLRDHLIKNGLATSSRFSLTNQYEMFVTEFENILNYKFDTELVKTTKQELEHGTLEDQLKKVESRFQPLISVLVPTYNQAKYLPTALDSLIAQTYENWEAIVVNDGSTDETDLVMQQYTARDPRIKLFHTENRRKNSALNEGLRNAKGQWICLLRPDDIFEPDKLEVHVKIAEQKSEIKFFHSNYYFLDEKADIKKADIKKPVCSNINIQRPFEQFQVLHFFLSNYIHSSSVAIHRSIFDRVGNFNEKFRYSQDFDMWLRISALYRSCFINDMTCVTRTLPRQVSDTSTETTLCDSPEIYDSARACLDFLNKYEFPAIFPSLDLSITEQALPAITSTLKVATDPLSYINRCGFAPALMDRLYEWFTNSASAETRIQIKPQLVQTLKNIQKTDLPEEIKKVFQISPEFLENSFKYTSYNPIDLMSKYYDKLEKAEDRSRAILLKQHLDEISHTKKPNVPVNNQPLFSVLVPVYNQAKHLPEALDSILSQTYDNWEAIVVNDGSTDKTAEVMKHYAKIDSRIRIFHKDNGGVASALNEGLRNARGEWICWLSSDDFFEPNKLEIHLKYINENPNIFFFNTNYLIFDEKTGTKCTLKEDPRELVSPVELQILKFFERNCANGISVAIHRKVFDNVGWFNEKYRYGQDFEMWFRINANYRRFFIDHKTCVTRWHTGQETNKFPGFGFYDSSRACIDFLNSHKFSEYFPLLDLTVLDEAVKAIKETLTVALNLNAIIHKCYFNTALLERLGEWLSQECPKNLKQMILPKLEVTINETMDSQLPEEIKTALFAFQNNIKNDFHFRPHNFTEEASEYSQKLFSAGYSEKANSIKRYLSLINPDSEKTDIRSNIEYCKQFQDDENIEKHPLTSQNYSFITNSALGTNVVSQEMLSNKKDINCHSNRNKPVVSIIMPVYNSADYISETIESVLIQNYRNFELIIVDDGSTDSTKDIITSFKNDKIKYFYKENSGPSDTRNLALKQSRGKYIIPLDADDMMTPDFIAKHLQEFEMHPEADLVYCDDYLIDENSKPIRVIQRPEYTDRKSLIRDLFHCGFPLIPFRTCFRKSVLDKIGLFDKDLLVGEDYDMIRRFVKHGLKMHHLQDALYLRRMTNNSLSKSYSIEKAKCHFEVIKRFTDTFNYDELFPDVAWDQISPQIRHLHAKCLTAGTYLAIGQEYVKSKAVEYSKKAFDLACLELNDCIKMDPENRDLQQLFHKSQLIRARYNSMPQQVGC